MYENDFVGFAGDDLLKDKLADICTKNDIKTIIETGTFVGGSTYEFSKMTEHVISIECAQEFFDIAVNNLKDRNNIELVYARTEDVLGDCISRSKGNLLLFLDAHWDGTPLLEELRIIKESGTKPIMVIHDFKNPEKPHYKYDIYPKHNIVYKWNYIRDSIVKIYGEEGFFIEYNKVVNGEEVGVIFIYPK